MAIALTDITALHFWRTHPHALGLCRIPSRRRSLSIAPPSAAALAELGSFGIDTQGDAHVLISSQRDCRRLLGGTCHLLSGGVPSRSLVVFAPGIMVASPELALAQAALTHDVATLALLCHEFCGTYRAIDEQQTAYGQDPLTSTAALAAFCRRSKGLYGVGALRRVIESVCDNSGSPAESALASAFCLPRCRGGYGLPKPALNQQIELNDAARRTLHHERIRPDFLWPGVAGEYDGRLYHSDGEQAERDERRRTAYNATGLDVVIFSTRHMKSTRALDDQVALVRRRLGIRRPATLPRNYDERHEQLLASLCSYWRGVHSYPEMPGQWDYLA